MATLPFNYDYESNLFHIRTGRASSTNATFKYESDFKPASHWPQFRKLSRHERRKRAAELRRGSR